VVFPVAPEKLKFPENACAKELFVETARSNNAAKAKRDKAPKQRKSALTEEGMGVPPVIAPEREAPE
jgi:hypothetical protein